MAITNPFRRGPKPEKTMENDQVKNDHVDETYSEQLTEQHVADKAAEANANDADTASATTLQAELDVLRTEHAALHDKHVRLFAEFDNFRKRTAREKLELMQFGGESSLKAILPILDDLDRAVVNNAQVDDIEAVKEGFRLIQQKMQHILAGQGLKPMEDPKGQPFDTDRHEAITQAPAPSEELKGRVIDVVETGYTLHDKVIRYAKVVVGV